MDEEDYPSSVGHLQPCGFCGRTFNPESLKKHERICQKNASKQRKTFDSQKQRTVTDAANGGVRVPATRPKQMRELKSTKNNWRQKHDEFIQTVRAARGVTKALKEGKELPPPPPPTINPDYIQCPHCMRRFNEHAAERHIKFCADQHKRLETRVKAKTAATVRAAEKQERRTAYRPPLPTSGLRRTVNLSSGQSGYSSTSSRSSGQQRAPRKNASTMRMAARSNTDIMKTRFNDNSTFDTSLPSSAVVTTRTGLKARVLASNSSSDIDSSDFEAPTRGPGRHTTASSSKHSSYQGYYQPTVKAKSTRTNGPSHSVTKYDWDFNFDQSPPEVLRQNGVRKTSTSRARQTTSVNTNNGFGHDISSRHENSLNDFVAREFGSKYKSASQHNGMHTSERDSSSFANFSSNDDRYKGQDEPARIISKDTSFASDGSRDSFNAPNPTSRFCHECGSRYPVQTAKFCCECGMRRIQL